MLTADAMDDRAGPARGSGWVAVAAASVAAFAYSLCLVAQARPGVFYSGDGGLKFLMTLGYASGQASPELRLAAPAWVRDLWAGGLFPFEWPFVHAMDGKTFVQYPPWFPLASVPGYLALGQRGLYAVPLIGLWSTWAGTIVACRGLGVGPRWTAAAVLALAFSTPLSLYGAMFWEHTAGVALALGGFVLVFAGRGSPGAARGVLAGASLALAAWFRPELAVLAAAAVVAAWTAVHSRLGRAARLAATAAVLAVLGAWAAINVALYGRPAGLHGLNVLAGFSVGGHLAGAAALLSPLLQLLLLHFPLVVPVVLVSALMASRRPPGLDPRVPIWLWSGAAFCLLVPLVLPGPQLSGYGGKQWGPRYLLAVMPVLLAAGAASFQAAWRTFGRRGRAAVGILAGAAFGYGLHANAYAGSLELRADYAGRVLPALETVRASPADVVAVSNQYVSQELASTMQRKSFVLARNGAELDAVGAAALEAGVPGFLFVSDASLNLGGSRWLRPGQRAGRMDIALSGVMGAYAVHEVRVAWAPR